MLSKAAALSQPVHLYVAMSMSCPSARGAASMSSVANRFSSNLRRWRTMLCCLDLAAANRVHDIAVLIASKKTLLCRQGANVAMSKKKTIAPNETTIMLGQQILKRVEFAEESQAKVGRLMGYPESIQTICYLEEDKAIRFQKFPCLEEDSIFQLCGSAFIQNNNLCLPQDSQNLCICICFGSPAANTNYRFE